VVKKINRKVLTTALIALILASLLSFIPSAAVAKTITVGGSGAQYTSIQSAINAASAGDTITVNGGTYKENVNVNKAVSLVGSGTPIVSPSSGDAFTITASGASVTGFKVTSGKNGFTLSHVSNVLVKGNTITGLSSGDGVYMTYVDHSTVTGNNADHNYFGIEMYDSKFNTISGNTLNVNHEIDIYMERVSDSIVKGNNVGNNPNENNQGGDGIGQRYGTNMTIDGNYVGKHYYGIKVYLSNKTTVQNNIAEYSGCNIRFDFQATNCVARNNTVRYGVNGFLLNATASYITVEGNTIYGLREAVYILNDNNMIIRGNTAYNDTYGVRAQNSAGNTIVGNDFINVGTGVYLSGSNNQVYLNDLATASISGSSNTFNTPSAASYQYNGATYSGKLGNYWTGYKGSVGSNGVGTSSYSYGGATDSYPLAAKHTSYVTSANPTPTATPKPTATPTPTPAPTLRPTATPTATPTPTPKPTATPTATPKPTATPTPTPAPTSRPIVEPTPVPGTTLYDDFGSQNASLWSVVSTDNGPQGTKFVQSNVAFAGDCLAVSSDAQAHTGGEYKSIKEYSYGNYQSSMRVDMTPGTEATLMSFANYTGGRDEIDMLFQKVNGKNLLSFTTTANSTDNSYTYELPFDPAASYHVYGFNWQTGRVGFYIDNSTVWTSTKNIPTHPGNLIYNNWVETSPPAGATTSKMIAAYVSISPNNVGAPAPTAAPTPTATPTVTPKPTVVPTAAPTAAPTATPTPTATPIVTPTPAPGTYAVDNMRTMAHYNGATNRMENFNVASGTALAQDVYYMNIGSSPDTYTVSVLGVPASWCKVNMYEGSIVQPSDFRSGYVTITPTLPGTYHLNLQVQSTTHPGVHSTVSYVLSVK